MIEILPGPLTCISRAIEARLKLVLPPNVFTHRWLPAKMDLKVWELLIHRCPSVSLEYAGFEKAENTSGLIGTGIWNIWLAVKNASSAEGGIFGDSLAPHGAMMVHQAAMVALHGMNVKGAGSVVVVKAEPLALKDRDDPGIYVVCVTVKADRIEIAGDAVLTGGLADPGTLTTEVINWSFGDSGVIDQTDTIISTGTV